MHHQTLVSRATRGEESGEGHPVARTERLRLQRDISEHQRIDFATHVSFDTGFDLAGFMLDSEFEHRHTGRRPAKCSDFGDDSVEDECVTHALRAQALACCSAGFASSAAGAVVSDLAFSSFIIGDGAV